MAPSLLDAYIPKPNLRLEFPLKPHRQWAQLELFISWWMGLNNPERRQRECVDLVFRSQLMHQSQICPLTHHSSSSPLNCGNLIHACHNKSKVTAHWGESGVFASAAGK